MNKRKKVAARKHRRAQKRLLERRQEAIEAGAEKFSKGKLHRLIGPAIHPKE